MKDVLGDGEITWVVDSGGGPGGPGDVVGSAVAGDYDNRIAVYDGDATHLQNSVIRLEGDQLKSEFGQSNLTLGATGISMHNQSEIIVQSDTVVMDTLTSTPVDVNLVATNVSAVGAPLLTLHRKRGLNGQLLNQDLIGNIQFKGNTNEEGKAETVAVGGTITARATGNWLGGAANATEIAFSTSAVVEGPARKKRLLISGNDGQVLIGGDEDTGIDWYKLPLSRGTAGQVMTCGALQPRRAEWSDPVVDHVHDQSLDTTSNVVFADLDVDSLGIGNVLAGENYHLPDNNIGAQEGDLLTYDQVLQEVKFAGPKHDQDLFEASDVKFNDLETTGVLTIAKGTNALPSLVMDGDPETGFYHDGLEPSMTMVVASAPTLRVARTAPNPPLDNLLNRNGTPQFCVGLRRLLTSYTGPLMAVYGDDFQFHDIEYDIRTGGIDPVSVAAAGTLPMSIITWYDQSGNGRNLVSANLFVPFLNVPSLRVVDDVYHVRWERSNSSLMRIAFTDTTELSLNDAEHQVHVCLRSETLVAPTREAIIQSGERNNAMYTQPTIAVSWNDDPVAMASTTFNTYNQQWHHWVAGCLADGQGDGGSVFQVNKFDISVSAGFGQPGTPQVQEPAATILYVGGPSPIVGVPIAPIEFLDARMSEMVIWASRPQGFSENTLYGVEVRNYAEYGGSGRAIEVADRLSVGFNPATQYRLPAFRGSENQVIRENGNGNLEWRTFDYGKYSARPPNNDPSSYPTMGAPGIDSLCITSEMWFYGSFTFDPFEYEGGATYHIKAGGDISTDEKDDFRIEVLLGDETVMDVTTEIADLNNATHSYALDIDLNFGQNGATGFTYTNMTFKYARNNNENGFRGFTGDQVNDPVDLTVSRNLNICLHFLENKTHSLTNKMCYITRVA